MKPCLGCGGALPEPFLDLGRTPLANAYRRPEDESPEHTYRLAIAHCPACHLVQLTELVPPEQLFGEYLYFSSYSDSFVAHAKQMVAHLVERLQLGSDSFAIEVASNDGYLLQHFVARGIPVLGVEPASNIAQVANEKGIRTLQAFFNPETAAAIRAEHGPADVLIGNNVLAHVPMTNAFAQAVEAVLKPDGVAVFEVPYLQTLLDHVEFDTIYHEHVFYFSVTALQHLFARARLELFDVQLQSVHGGSLRIFLQKPGIRPVSQAVRDLLQEEERRGLTQAATYTQFAKRVEHVKERLLALLRRLKSEGKVVAAYGAPAKGNTLLNYCGIGTDLVAFTVDRSPYKQGLLTPGMHLPILAPEALTEKQPDYAVILPWNIQDEILQKQALFQERGGRFIVPIPEPAVLG